jgi:phenylpyruvate tautomerase PptA (4-oxalocrotonate tautomerase family)
MRPICTLAVPPDLEHDAKQRLVRHISKTISEACGRDAEEIHLPPVPRHVAGVKAVRP